VSLYSANITLCEPEMATVVMSVSLLCSCRGDITSPENSNSTESQIHDNFLEVGSFTSFTSLFLMDLQFSLR
jgi:hypothetical protein